MTAVAIVINLSLPVAVFAITKSLFSFYRSYLIWNIITTTLSTMYLMNLGLNKSDELPKFNY